VHLACSYHLNLRIEYVDLYLWFITFLHGMVLKPREALPYCEKISPFKVPKGDVYLDCKINIIIKRKDNI